MAQTFTLCDEYGIIYQAMKILPNDQLKIDFLEALAELENSECHRTRTFPKTRLHKVTGVKQAIYRADIDKTSGWRIHVQYINKQIHLKWAEEYRLLYVAMTRAKRLLWLSAAQNGPFTWSTVSDQGEIALQRKQPYPVLLTLSS